MKRLMFVMALMLAGCNGQVPTGHVGRVRTLSGFSKDAPLAPGLHTCFGRDQMYLLEVSDKQFSIPMSVLCKDQLNFKFDIGVLVSVNKTKSDLINDAFENVTPAGDCIITMDQLFQMYVKPIVDQEARKVVSRYETREIAINREQVIEGIRAATNQAIDDSLMVVKRITVNNLDFPDVITQAQEARAQRQIEVETMKAETERQLEKARGQLRVAQLEYERQLIEAAMIADSNKIIGASITPGFIAWHELKVLGEAAKGPNNWGFIPYTSPSQQLQQLDTNKFTQITLDQELMGRIQNARDRAVKAEAAKTTSAPASVIATSTPASPAEDTHAEDTPSAADSGEK